jgi:hypothetical protein
MEPLSVMAALSVANKAFNGVSRLVSKGHEIESTLGQLGKWFEALADVNAATERSKNPPLFKKIAGSKSIEKEALDCVIAKQKMYQQRKELRELILYSYGKDVWDDLLATEKQIRTERKNQIYKRLEFKQKMIDFSCIILGGLTILSIIIGFLMIIASGGD